MDDLTQSPDEDDASADLPTLEDCGLTDDSIALPTTRWFGNEFIEAQITDEYSEDGAPRLCAIESNMEGEEPEDLSVERLRELVADLLDTAQQVTRLADAIERWPALVEAHRAARHR
jgi:hypothetical protein